MSKTEIDMRHMSDTAIYKMAYQEWLLVLSQLWEAIGKPIDEKQLAVYVKQLRHVPMHALEAAISVLLREHTWHTIPTIGEIWDVLTKLYQNPNDVTAMLPEGKPWVWRLWGEGEEVEVL